MTWWIASWFASSMALSVPATAYMTVPKAAYDLANDGNAFNLLISTHATATYLYYLSDLDAWGSESKVFKVKEKNLKKYASGKLYMTTKTGAKYHWAVTSSAYDIPFSSQNFTVSNDSTTFMRYVYDRNIATKEVYRIYEGREYKPQDKYEVSFKAK